MKKSTLTKLLLITVVIFSCPTYAALSVTIGKPTEVFVDPGDVVVVLDTAGACGSNYFHIQRANRNFKEFSALVITANTARQRLRLFVSSCSGDRNIVSHGGAAF